jgi:hypothetical protein
VLALKSTVAVMARACVVSLTAASGFTCRATSGRAAVARAMPSTISPACTRAKYE